MLNRHTAMRFAAVPVCVLWGLREWLALQRAHGRQHPQRWMPRKNEKKELPSRMG